MNIADAKSRRHSLRRVVLRAAVELGAVASIVSMLGYFLNWSPYRGPELFWLLVLALLVQSIRHSFEVVRLQQQLALAPLDPAVEQVRRKLRELAGAFDALIHDGGVDARAFDELMGETRDFLRESMSGDAKKEFFQYVSPAVGNSGPDRHKHLVQRAAGWLDKKADSVTREEIDPRFVRDAIVGSTL